MNNGGIYKTNTPTTMKLGIHTAPFTGINILRFGCHGNILAGKYGFYGNKMKYFYKMAWWFSKYE